LSGSVNILLVRYQKECLEVFGDPHRNVAPVRSGTTPAPETPAGAALAQRLLRLFMDGSLALLAATIVVSALTEAAEPKPHGLLSRLIG
jgi:hypothetical protein